VAFIGNSATDFNASTVTVNSETQITAVAPKASFLNAQEPYGVKVLNVSGLSGILASQINVDTSPSWSTASGQIGGSLFDNEAVNTSVTATDSDGDTIAYSVQSGSLPSGLSLNTSSGAITGTAGDVSADTTSSFTLRATANSKTADRAFNIIIKNDLTSVVDFFGDSSGKSLFMFDNNGTDTGGVGNFTFAHGGGFGGSAGNVSYNTSTKKLGTHSLYKLSNGHYGYLSSRGYSNYTVCGWHNPSNINNGDTHFAGLFGNQSSAEVITSKLTSTGDTYLGINISGVTGGNGESSDKYVANAIGCPTLSNGTWYHWTWTRDGTDTRLYVNGVLGATITEAIGSIHINHTLYLGTASTQLGNGTYDTYGYYDNIRIFNKKLSQSEITTLYNFESTR